MSPTDTLLLPLFQFHYGTIKRGQMRGGCVAGDTYFNSTMVRLKVNCIASPVMLLCYFNSTMVRLKAAARMQGGRVAVFQFHYGTIKSKTSVT